MANSLTMKRTLTTSMLALGLAVALSACASDDRARTVDAVAAPLADINLRKEDIPPLLSSAVGAEYQLPLDTGCEAIAQNIADFDAILGNDSNNKDESGLYQKGKKKLKDATFNAIQSTSESVIPFRGWVRKLSGAERHSKKARAAIEAGSLRRAFLKGLSTGQGCISH